MKEKMDEIAKKYPLEKMKIEQVNLTNYDLERIIYILENTDGFDDDLLIDYLAHMKGKD